MMTSPDSVQKSRIGGISPEPLQNPIENVQAPKLRNPEYQISPSLSTLQEMSAEELTSVKHLVIGRADGKCRVEFLQDVNLLRCNIDECLALDSNGKITFYPSGNPPPLGQGLMVACRCVVNGHIGASSKSLKRHCAKEGTIFHEYRGNTWTYLAHTGDFERESMGSTTSSDNDGSSISGSSSLSDSESVSDSDGELARPVVRAGRRIDETSPVSHDKSPVFSPPSNIHWTPADHSHSPPNHPGVVPTSTRPPVVLPSGDQERIQLPYKLREAVPKNHAEIAFLPATHASPRRQPIFVVKKEVSATHRSISAPKAQEKQDSSLLLGRSFRVGWGPRGTISLPSFSELSDLKETSVERSGVHVTIARPFFNQQDVGRVEQFCNNLQSVSLIDRTNVRIGAAIPDLGRPLLKGPALDKLAAGIAAGAAPGSRQFYDALRLATALFVADSDAQFDNPEEEECFRSQFRRRKLGEWIDAQVKSTSDNQSNRQPVLRALIEHRLDDALRLCANENNTELQRIVAACGSGNIVGDLLSGADTDDVLRLLMGEVENLLREPTYLSRDSGTTAKNPAALAWKQLLGVFFFYACPSDFTAEDVVRHFAQRLYSIQQARQEGALPTYASVANVSDATRFGDVMKRGHRFEDALLSLLIAFANKESPSPSMLHPHASTYWAEDYATPFLLLLVVRAAGLPRSAAFREYEHHAIMGFAAFLEQHDLWFWSVFVLEFIESDESRRLAVERVLACHRTEHRSAEADRVLDWLGVDTAAMLRTDSEFQGYAPLPEHNAPTLESLAKLQAALAAFCSPKRKQRG